MSGDTQIALVKQFDDLIKQGVIEDSGDLKSALIFLLEKQTAMPVVNVHNYDKFGDKLLEGSCPKCGASLHRFRTSLAHKERYCLSCGQKVVWNE